MADSDTCSEPMQVDATAELSDENECLEEDTLKENYELVGGNEAVEAVTVTDQPTNMKVQIKPDTFYNIQNPSIDLESYAEHYQGLARLERLMFIAKHCQPLRFEALKIALQFVKMTHNYALYTEIAGSIKEYEPEFDPGKEYLEMPQSFALILDKLIGDQKDYHNNSIKESIRRGCNDLGDHYLSGGDLPNALKNYSRARDYCTTKNHIILMCLNIIRVSIHQKNWRMVVMYAKKAISTKDINNSKDTPILLTHPKLEAQAIATRLQCALGVANLANRNYKMAGLNFLKSSFVDLECYYISAYNITAYGVLCAMATFDRNEIYEKVIMPPSFKPFLELDPVLREAMNNFYGSKYKKCFKMLEDMKDTLLCDIYLAPHVNTLMKMIRNKAMVQYFSPYSSCDLNQMAATFNVDVMQLENEISALILDGQIQGAIDSHNKVLLARNVDKRIEVYEKTVQMAKEFQKTTKIMAFRSALLKHKVEVQLPVKWNEWSGRSLTSIGNSVPLIPRRSNLLQKF